MPIQRLTKYLDANGVKYTKIEHSPAFTAPEIAAVAHVPGKELAKTVMVKINGTMSMVVLPSSFHIDLEALRHELNAKKVQLATEVEFKDYFPECELGAMPPFGNLWDVPVYVATVLRQDREIVFNAGTHRQLLRLAYADFEKLVKPKVVEFASIHA